MVWEWMKDFVSEKRREMQNTNRIEVFGNGSALGDGKMRMKTRTSVGVAFSDGRRLLKLPRKDTPRRYLLEAQILVE